MVIAIIFLLIIWKTPNSQNITNSSKRGKPIIEGITSFSIAPLKLATYVGFFTALSAFAYALVIIYKTLFFGESVRGYPSLMVVILFLGGIQLITLGIIGEYLGRTFDESKQRPLYLVSEYLPSIHFRTQS